MAATGIEREREFYSPYHTQHNR